MRVFSIFAAALVAASARAENFEFASGDLRLTFRDDGRITKLTDTAGRSYLSDVVPWVSRIEPGGKWSFAGKASKRQDGALVFAFADGSTLVESVKPFDGGFVFTVEDCSPMEGMQSLQLAMLRPGCGKYTGGFSCVSSDDERAICLRSFDYRLGMSTARDAMKIFLDRPEAAKGLRFGLAAGPRDGILARLQALVKESGLYYSRAGGPWSLDSEEARQSYMFANCQSRNIDAWIDAARRAGVSIFHFHCWWDHLGHYGVNRDKFPRGLADLKAAADKVRAAGMNVSLHSLTACIDFHDPWVSPVCHSNLIATCAYTLARPITADSQEVVVNEPPGPNHDVVTTYTSNGNLLEIDGELIEYRAVRREEPYAFTGIVRGSQRTKVRDHAAGTRVKYLQQRYFCFYPEPDSPLATELADRLAGVYNAIGSDMIYFDGSEGMKSMYGTAKMASLIASRLDASRHPPRIEMSCCNPHFWPFRSTIGAWDNVCYGAKGFEDDHIRSNVEMGRMSNFLDGQMGWWAPQLASSRSRSRFPDETEYFAAKNAGHDFAMSIQGVSANAGFIPDLQERALTTVGWYERFRLARAFAPDVRKELATLGREGRLAQDGTGAWTYTPVEVMRQRVLGEGLGDKWTCRAKAAAPVSLRIETFYNLSPFESPAAQRLFDVESFADAKTVSVPEVRLRRERMSDPERGEVTRLTAFNDTGRSRGAYACLERAWPRPYLDLGSAAGVGFWVKGDGSGAVLNVQLQNSRDYYGTCADNLVKLDFKGWRYVEFLFRERDTEEASKYAWPHRIGHPEQMCGLQLSSVMSARVYLNEIPVSAAEGVLDANATEAAARSPSVDILLSEIKALGMKETTSEDIRLKLNGQKVELPFEELAAGDWAELENGVWTLYGEKGDFKERAAGPHLALKAGENRFRYSADVSNGAQARAEVKVFVHGRPQPALAALSEAQRKELDWEPEMPANWAPSKGADDLPPVKVRPGEKARLEVKIRGPLADPAVMVNGQAWKLASVPAKSVRTFTDGPVVTGVAEVKMLSSDPTTADALVEFAKLYVK